MLIFAHRIHVRAMRDALWHARAAHSILIAALFKVANDPALLLAALCLRIQIRNVAERVLRVICQRPLIMKKFIMSLGLFQATKLLHVTACSRFLLLKRLLG